MLTHGVSLLVPRSNRTTMRDEYINYSLTVYDNIGIVSERVRGKRVAYGVVSPGREQGRASDWNVDHSSLPIKR